MPRKPSGETLKLECRITPPDQQPITDWYEKDLQATVLLVASEGTPNGAPRLHYHIYLETPVSKSSVRLWILKVLDKHIDKDVKYNGNSLYFTRQPHDHTIPYIVKSRNVLVRIGITQSVLEDYYQASDEYNKSKNNARKKQQRSRLDEFEDLYNTLKEDLENKTLQNDVDSVVSRALAICYAKSYEFPTRMTMDKLVLKLLYPYNEYLVRSFYTKSYSTYH